MELLVKVYKAKEKFPDKHGMIFWDFYILSNFPFATSERELKVIAMIYISCLAVYQTGS